MYQYPERFTLPDTGYWYPFILVTFVIDSNDVKNTYQSIITVISKMIVSD